MNERSVEIPFALSCVRGDESRILDVGCAEAQYLEELPKQKVIGIDVREHYCPVTHVVQDICRSTLPDGFFDLILCVSTLDHIGFAAYGQAPREGAWMEAIAEMRRLLCKNGRLVLTIPYGKSGLYPFAKGEQKVFGAAEWAQMKLPTLLREEYYQWNGVRYRPCSADDLADAPYGDNKAVGVLCVEMGE